MKATALHKQILELIDMIECTSIPRHRDPFAFTVREARHLADHGESAVALELVCSNLHEFSVTLAPQLLERLETLARQLGVHPLLIEELRQSSYRS